ncbi:hypothetical protein VNI00_018138 [Paramarasmius palmivorus]|uniref:Uncharacterized protein n=1 Tax=Paramarasmius palmivorus TaxID=297713 RepID=A0AAW0B0M3_9AGAR
MTELICIPTLMPESIPPTPELVSNLNTGDRSSVTLQTIPLSSSQPAAGPQTITPPPCAQPHNIKAELSLESFSSESSNVPTPPPCAQPWMSTISVTTNMSPPSTAPEGYLVVVRYNVKGTASAATPTPTPSLASVSASVTITPSNTTSDIAQGTPSKRRKLDCNSASEMPLHIVVPVAGPSSSSCTVPVTLASEQHEGEDQESSPPRLPSSPLEILSPHLLAPGEASPPQLPSSPIEISSPCLLVPDVDI